VSDPLAKGVMEIDRFFESGPLYAISQVGVKTAGLIDFEIERLDAVVFGRLSARRIFSGPGHSAGSVLFFCDCRHLSVTRP
jgi:glyoxylase-like metal-dependent hydrolase (beta-lactamase superfamily II)